MTTSFKDKIQSYFRASYSFLWIQTHEETRVIKDITTYLLDTEASKAKPTIYEWDSITGLSTKVNNQPGSNRVIPNTDQVKTLLDQLKDLCSKHEWQVFILKDFHPYLNPQNVNAIRALRNLAVPLKTKGNLIIFVSPVINIPVELEKNVQILDYQLPNEKGLEARLDFVRKATGDKYTLTPEIKQSAIEAAKGMTELEAENAYTLALVENGEFNKGFVHTVFTEKVTHVKKSGLLTYIEPDVSFDQVGGLIGLKNWISTRSKAYTPDAREYGLPYPKGILLCGIPGCGKTLLAKATAKELGFPLFQLDVGSLFGKLVGETEENFRKVIKTVDGIGRCVLFIDEIEKALNKEAVSGRGDTGTSSRSFGTLLTWLSDHSTPVFVIGTSNNFTVLPPEMIRKGRFDELFWIDLPTKSERKDIFGVLLKKYNRDAKKFNLDTLAKESEGFTGSEIENVITSAMFTCFAKSKEIQTSDLITEIKLITPQSKINSEDLDKMRQTAEGKLRIAVEDGTIKEITEEFRSIAIT